MPRVDLKELDGPGLEALVAELGQKPYRARQIERWVYVLRAGGIESMTDLSKAFRARLGRRAFLSDVRPAKVEESRDGTRKLLFRLADGELVEAVLIRERGHLTLCLSSQVGCAMGCRFCKTGTLGLKRNLSRAEIINQVLAAFKLAPEGSSLTNLVFMGMGEPLANLDNLVSAINVLTEPGLVGLSRRRLSVSTVGLVPLIPRLAQSGGVGLTVSLNSADDKVRSWLMPVNEKFGLEALHRALKAFPLSPRRMITVAYVMLAGVNDTEEDARKLTRFLAGLRAKVNLIPFNPVEGIPFERPGESAVEAFRQTLVKKNYTAVVRHSKGQDISAACGQLAAKHGLEGHETQTGLDISEG